MTAALTTAALSLSDRVQEFGAYAGLAAILGLAVLAMLYFAQAREVKRLREWAGTQPERAAQWGAARPGTPATAAGAARAATPGAAGQPAGAGPAGAPAQGGTAAAGVAGAAGAAAAA